MGQIIDEAGLSRNNKKLTKELQIQKSTLPTASVSEVNHIYQYIGTTGNGLTNGYYYKCVNNNGTYEWQAINVQDGSGSSVQSDWSQTDNTADDYIKNKPTIPEVIQYNTMPTPSAEYAGKIIQYTGQSIQDSWVTGCFYKCTKYSSNPDVYAWSFLTTDTPQQNSGYPITSGGVYSALQGKQNIIQYSTMPTAGSNYANKIIQYIGETDSTYTKGYFYICNVNASIGSGVGETITYEWVAVNVQAGGGSVQSDWSQTDSAADDYIKNKPDLTEHLPIIPKTKKTDVGVSIDDVSTAIDVTWNGLTNFDGYYIWTDGTDIYYSKNTKQYILDKFTSTWTTKTWSGLTNFDGYLIWTDGTDIYYSYGSSAQYVLDKSTSTWTTKTWSGLTDFISIDIWTDGTDIYCSDGSSQYVLDKSTSTWTTKTWSGLTNFGGNGIWTDGTDIYYSYGLLNQYILDKSTSTWTTKTWSGLTDLIASFIWTDGTDIYYSYDTNQYILDKSTSTWTTKTWSGLTSFNSSSIWTDGTDIYYSHLASSSIHKKIISRRHINNNFNGNSGNVQSDWSQTDSTADDYIKNKPTIPVISQSATLTLTVNNWNSTTLQQTVTFAHDTTKRNVIDITVSEVENWADCGVLPVSETASGITFKCNTIPSSALTFTVCSMSVS